MFRTLMVTSMLILVFAAGASASSKSVVYLTLRVGAFDAGVNVDPPSAQPPICSATDCKFAFDQGTLITLTAAPTSMSPFMGWSRGCASFGTAPVCSGRLNANTTVGASFSRLTIRYATGKGGHLELSPQHGTCGDGCLVFGYHEQVVLHAVPNPGYHVGYWSGACDGGSWSTCTISNLSVNADVYVKFARNDGLGFTEDPVGTGSRAKVSVSGRGTASGLVAALPFNCAGLSCSIYPDLGSPVAVTAKAAAGWKFSRWTGRCVGRASVCIFMNQPWPSSPVPTVQAIFVPA